MAMPWDPWAPKSQPYFWRPHEVLWIEAARTLPFQDRMRAFRDISRMTGATWEQVRHKASSVGKRRKRELLKIAAE